ncbi:hypothetical protein BpHYR1_022050 [Brachionus plicatilis]|uniref:Uncharacterized protein n=1 Tax=Brachionus plicatilis TaxID=10195 RepID=A0A3M7PTM3_BRAPC|nr:hypothetical protein BpHYR1_022050 [Brachionus plicatilis]
MADGQTACSKLGWSFYGFEWPNYTYSTYKYLNDNLLLGFSYLDSKYFLNLKWAVNQSDRNRKSRFISLTNKEEKILYKISYKLFSNIPETSTNQNDIIPNSEGSFDFGDFYPEFENSNKSQSDNDTIVTKLDIATDFSMLSREFFKITNESFDYSKHWFCNKCRKKVALEHSKQSNCLTSNSSGYKKKNIADKDLNYNQDVISDVSDGEYYKYFKTNMPSNKSGFENY